MLSTTADSACPRCCPPLFPWLPSAPCVPRAQSQVPRHGQLEKVSSISWSVFGMVSLRLGCAGEVQRRTSLRLWLEGPKPVESGVRSTALRPVGRTKAVGAQVCCARLELERGMQCVGRYLAQATQGAGLGPALSFQWEGRREDPLGNAGPVTFGPDPVACCFFRSISSGCWLSFDLGK